LRKNKNEMEIICPVCKKRPAFKSDYWGYLPCPSCRQKQSGYSQPHETVEVTTQEIKDSRVKYKNEIIQPYREGQLSKEYIKQYGTKGVKATKQEIKNAKNVWDENSYYKEDD